MTSRTSFNTFAINGYDEDRAMHLVQPKTRSSFHTVDRQSIDDKFFFREVEMNSLGLWISIKSLWLDIWLAFSAQSAYFINHDHEMQVQRHTTNTLPRVCFSLVTVIQSTIVT